MLFNRWIFCLSYSLLKAESEGKTLLNCISPLGHLKFTSSRRKRLVFFQMRFSEACNGGSSGMNIFPSHKYWWSHLELMHQKSRYRPSKKHCTISYMFRRSITDLCWNLAIQLVDCPLTFAGKWSKEQFSVPADGWRFALLKDDFDVSKVPTILGWQSKWLVFCLFVGSITSPKSSNPLSSLSMISSAFPLYKWNWISGCALINEWRLSEMKEIALVSPPPM